MTKNSTTNNILLKVPELKVVAEENKEHIVEAIKVEQEVFSLLIIRFMSKLLVSTSKTDSQPPVQRICTSELPFSI